MKRVITLFAFVLFGGLAMNAQCTKTADTNGKACCASKNQANAGSKACAGMAVASAEADAAMGSNVQKRVCSETGKVTYYEKSVSPDSKSVTWSEVTFDASTKKFTKVASASMERNATTGEVKNTTPSCSKDGTKKCCKDKGAKTE